MSAQVNLQNVNFSSRLATEARGVWGRKEGGGECGECGECGGGEDAYVL